MKAYQHLIKHAIAAGLTVSVHDGEVWAVKRSVEYRDIIAAVNSVEECSLRFRNVWRGDIIGSAYVAPFEDDECTVCDYSVTPFMEQWNTEYHKTTNQ
jgi:hypothetical protein